MWASFGSQLLVPWILLAQGPSMMDYVPVISGAPPPAEASGGIQDSVTMFGNGAYKQAQEGLGRIHREYLVPVRIETVKSLGGAWIADVARRRAQSIEARQLYILVAQDERDVGVIGARRGKASQLTDQERERIRRAFLSPLQAGNADAALERGIRALGATLETSTVSRRGRVGWDALSMVTIVVVALVALSASRAWAENDRSGWRRRRIGTTPPPVGNHSEPGSGKAILSGSARVSPSPKGGELLRTTRPPARRSERVEA